MRRSFSVAVISLLFLYLRTSEILAQSEHLHFIQLTPDNGLSSSITTSIVQDYKGFIWIGTPNGLNRYDGFNFVIYRNDRSDSASLADNVVQTLYEDNENRLFIGTEHGLCLYDREKDCFLNYLYDKQSPMRGLDFGVSKIIEDSSDNLWLATNAGLVYFDRAANKILRYTHDPAKPGSLSNDNVEAVLIDKFKRIWVSTRQGLNIFLPESGEFMNFSHSEEMLRELANATFIDMAEDQDGNIWLGSTDGLYCIRNSPEIGLPRFVHYRHDNDNKYSLSIDQITSLFADDSGKLWIGTENGGINLYDSKNNRFLHYRKDDYDTQSLNNESIEAIYQDKTGNLWFGTYSGGLNIAMKNRDGIVKYQNLPGAPFSLSHNSVTCFLEDRGGLTFVGTDGGGLNLFDKQINRFSRFNMENSQISSNAILCMLEDTNNLIWIGTWAGGLVRFDLKTKSFKSLTTKNSGIMDDNIYAIAEGENNDLWLGSFEHGLIHYQIRENKFTEFSPLNSGIGNQMVVKILKLSKGSLLLGTITGLQVFNTENDQFTTYSSDRKVQHSLSFPRVTDLAVENDSSVWVGTPDGLNRLNTITGSFKRYYDKDGLSNNFIKGLALDKTGALWVTNDRGVSRFNPVEEKFKNFTKADGFQSNEFNERSVLVTKSGDLFMGGTKGFNIVYPDKISENNTMPAVLITDLKLFNKSVRPGAENSPLTKNITETSSLILSHDQSVITFSFAVMDFSAPEKNQYAYKLENFDKDWIFPGNKGEATYTNLNPGDYVFHVKGSNNDGLWTLDGTMIKMTILPSWWNTVWFKILMILSLASLLLYIYFSRIRHLKMQKVLLKRSVELKTMELKELNASKDKFFSIIAHDLRNPFNAIIGFSEILKDESNAGNPHRMAEYAAKINVAAVKTLRLLENLLEWANSQREKIVFTPVLVNLNELYVEESATLNDIASDKNVELKNSLPENLVIIADRNMLKTVIRNLVSNAIKYTYRNGRVEIVATINGKDVEISVLDNGIGMTKEVMSKLFRIDANLSMPGTDDERGTGLGLFLCKEFIEKHGGKIWVEERPGLRKYF